MSVATPVAAQWTGIDHVPVVFHRSTCSGRRQSVAKRTCREASLCAVAAVGLSLHNRGGGGRQPSKRALQAQLASDTPKVRSRDTSLAAVGDTRGREESSGVPEFVRSPEALDEQVVSLALPAIVALCAEPLLSAIDTGFVGRLPNPALSLGGLGVATTVFDFVFRCYNFLCVVTVPLVAKAAAAQRCGNPDGPDPAQITGRIVGLAAFLGVVTWATLVAATPTALQLAGTSADSTLGVIASGYIGIRAAALPASLVNTVAVGAFRGQLDTVTPLQVTSVQMFTNVVLDYVLVFGVDALGIPALGVDGAALATAASVWLSCIAFCTSLSSRGLIVWEAALTWPLALLELQELVVGGAAQLLRTLSLQVVLLEFTRSVVGIDGGGLAAAAHQVALRIWFFALFALDSVAVAAQALLPVAITSSGTESARRVSLRLLAWGFGGGILTGIIIFVGAASLCALFTNDPSVQAAALPLIVLVATLQPLAGLVFTWDGMFQGLTDYAYLAGAMALSAGGTLAVLQVNHLSESLEGVWTCFALFLGFRAAGLAWRFWGPEGPLTPVPVGKAATAATALSGTAGTTTVTQAAERD